METIRIQSDDLRDELKELELWEDQITKAASVKQQQQKNSGQDTGGSTSTLMEENYFNGAPPIRGTVPSLKAAVQKELEAKKKTSPVDPVQVAKEKGNDYFRLNKLSEAIEAYTQGIEYSPNGKSTYILYGNRAMCYLRQELWEKAQSDANTCVTMNCTYAKGYYRRALASKNLGSLKEARKDLEAVLALVPNDAAAKNELEVVTKMIQVERSKCEERDDGTQGGKKRIVIQEVDDDEAEEEEEGYTKGEKESNVVNSEDYQQKLLDQQKEVERREREAEEIRRREIEMENKAKAVRFKQNDRVEVIEEVEEVRTAQREPDLSSGGGKAEGTTKGVREDSTGSSSPCTSREPPSRKLPSAKASKESLTPPKSYSEFERVFTSIEKDEELRTHYITLLNPAQIRPLFGCNMSPEVLYGILRSVVNLPKQQALEWLKGLSGVNRIDDITLFFNEEEQSVAKEACKYVEDISTPKVMASIKQKLTPF